MADEWLAGQNIEVEIAQLEDFARHIQAELDQNFRPSKEQGITPILRVEAPFGDGGLGEAQFFRARHDESRLAMESLLVDVERGLQVLADAARVIAQEYSHGDAMAKATQDDVYGAFTGSSAMTTGGTTDPATPGGTTVFEDGDLPDQEAGTASTGYSAPADQGAYGQETLGTGDGAYVIPADDQNLNSPVLDAPAATVDH